MKERILKFEATEEEVVAWYLRGVLEKNGGNQSETTRVLDIDRSTVRRRMERLGLVPSAPTSRSDLREERLERDRDSDDDLREHASSRDDESTSRLDPEPQPWGPSRRGE